MLKRLEHGEIVASSAQKRVKIEEPKAPEIQAERRVKMPTSSIEFVVHPAFFSSILLVIITLTLQIFGKNSDIIKGDRDSIEGFLHYGNRFQPFR